MTETPTYPRSKRELLERMRASREEWDALIAQIPETTLTAPVLAGGWSVKDLIAHVAAYEKWTAAQIRAATEDRAPTGMELYGVEEMPPDREGWDLDRQNAAIYAQYKDMPLTEVMAFSGVAFGDLVAAIEMVSDEDITRPGAQSWAGDAALLEIVPGQCYAHYEQHIDELKSISGDDIP
jgi:hypothetical protein